MIAGFTVPNKADLLAAGVSALQAASQSQPDHGDIEILTRGIGRVGVVSGCAVAAPATPALAVDVTVGTIILGGKYAAVAARTVTLPTADALLPRFDLVVADSSGTLSVLSGTSAQEPSFPTIGASYAVLAAIYVRAGATNVIAADITDKRVFVAGTWLTINTFEEGMVGDTVANDTAVINAAWAKAALIGGSCYCPTSAPLIDTLIAQPAPFFGDGPKNTRLIKRTNTGNMIDAIGTEVGSALLLAASVTLHDMALEYTSVTGLAIGDLVSIRDAQYFSSVALSQGRNRETNRITGIGGGGTATVALTQGAPIAITSSSVANPSVITTGVAHGLNPFLTTQLVTIVGHTSTPSINGVWVATVIDTTHFSIPVNVTVGGTGGTMTKATPLASVTLSGVDGIHVGDRVRLGGLGATVAITSSSVAGATVITTAAAHGLVSGDYGLIAGHTGATPSINGSWVVTVLSATTFSIPVTVTVGGTGGTVQFSDATKEFADVASISGMTLIFKAATLHAHRAGEPVSAATITLAAPVRSTYLSAQGAELVKLAPAQNIMIRDIGLSIGGLNGVGLNIDYGYEVHTRRVDISGMHSNYGIAMTRTAASSFGDGTHIFGGDRQIAGVSDGAIWINESSHDITVIKGHFENCSELPVSRNSFDILVAHSTFSGMYDSAVNSHGSYVRRLTVSDCLIEDTRGNGLACGYGSHTAGDVDVHFLSNDIYRSGKNAISVAAPVVAGRENVGTIVRGNTIIGFGYRSSGGTLAGVNVQRSLKVQVLDNTIDGAQLTNAWPNYGIAMTAASDGLVRGNTIKNITYASGYGILLQITKFNISTSSVGNPSLIVTTTAHQLNTDDTITISGHTGSTPTINGTWTVTVVDASSFTIPVNVTVAGTGGTVNYTATKVTVEFNTFLNNAGKDIYSDGLYASGATVRFNTSDKQFLTGTTTPAFTKGAADHWYRNEWGGAREYNAFTATMLAGQTSVTVAHGIVTPGPTTSQVQLTFGADPGTAGKLWVNGAGNTSIVIKIGVAQGSDLPIGVIVDIGT